MIALLTLAILILAGYGAWALVAGTFAWWHLLFPLAAFGVVLLAIRLGWVEIGNLRKK